MSTQHRLLYTLILPFHQGSWRVAEEHLNLTFTKMLYQTAGYVKKKNRGKDTSYKIYCNACLKTVEYFISREEACILLTQHHRWVIPQNFLKTWLNTFTWDLYGKTCAYELPCSICVLAAASETNEKSVSLPVDWTGFAGEEDSNTCSCACDKQFSNMHASLWYPTWDQFFWHFPPINLTVLHLLRGKRQLL